MAEVLDGGHLEGGGDFSERCHRWLADNTGTARALLTTSGTAGLEMARLLAGIQDGDEVIMPSFTFPSSANCVVLRGATPVFVDVDPITLNMSTDDLEQVLTARTRAIMPVHYAGVACDMSAISAFAKRHGLVVIEDAAQGIAAYHQDDHLGSLGSLGALSFHVSKNISCGEGGALLINQPDLIERAEILWEKGTDRARFIRGEVAKYEWQDLGSSFLPSEILAALLYAQLTEAATITRRRLLLWTRYQRMLQPLAAAGHLTLPCPPVYARHNAHIYFVILPSRAMRDHVSAEMRAAGIVAQTHYVPLHASPAGKRFAGQSRKLPVTEALASRLLRLPLFPTMTKEQQDATVSALEAATVSSSLAMDIG